MDPANGTSMAKRLQAHGRSKRYVYDKAIAGARREALSKRYVYSKAACFVCVHEEGAKLILSAVLTLIQT